VEGKTVISRLVHEVKDLVASGKNEREQFLKEQGEKLELYLNQLAKGEIIKQSKVEFNYDEDDYDVSEYENAKEQEES